MSSGEGLAGERPLRADARRNVEKVMEAAAEAFARDGLDVPLEDIARSAGVRAGTIYNRFGGREGLLDAVVADVAGRLAASGHRPRHRAGHGMVSVRRLRAGDVRGAGRGPRLQ